ncbi:hypothetical protein [Azospirillum soli]|uniref:hypothetical protein n=1 Tax=Azospirillum soli TaxID=1304799 RepID=UPI001AE1D5B9|nr:hypothetical protein [Azospirillum soli]MBP2316543.1 hypothetical protein [Azospirillum soli]
MKRTDTIIVTSANSAYVPLLNGLLESLRDHGADFPVGILDTGLSPADRDGLSPVVERTAVPDWHMSDVQRARFQPPEWIKAMTARPHLRDYFPGYRTYLWLDADTWVATPTALATLVAATSGRDIAIVPTVDPAYVRYHGLDALKARTAILPVYRTLLPEALAQTMLVLGELCSGVFAMPAGSPVWKRWAEEIGPILDFSAERSGTLYHIFEQTALNLAVHRHHADAAFLPARFNWVLGEAQPVIDGTTGRLHVPQPPHDPIEILHLIHSGRSLADKMAPLEARTLSGQNITTAFDYRSIRSLMPVSA